MYTRAGQRGDFMKYTGTLATHFNPSYMGSSGRSLPKPRASCIMT